MKIFRDINSRFYYIIDGGKVYCNLAPTKKNAVESAFTEKEFLDAIGRDGALHGLYERYDLTTWDLVKKDLPALALSAIMFAVVFVAIMTI